MLKIRNLHIVLPAILLPVCLQSLATPTDMLFNEQWALSNVPRTASNTPASVAASSYPTIGSCTEKPVFSNGSYSCASYTAAGVEDMDINAPEGWAVYSPSPTLPQNEIVIALIDTGIDYNHPDLKDKIWMNPGEATGQDSNNNGIDDGCEDAIDGDNNGYLNDCHGINSMVERFNANGSLNPAAGDPIDDNVGHGTNMSGVMAAIGNNNSASFHGGITGVTGFESHIKIATCKSGQFEGDVFPLIPGISVPAAQEKAIRGCLWYFHDLKQSGVNVVVINASGGMSKHINISNVMYPLVANKYLLNTPEMYALAAVLESDDIVVVAAAGNNGWSIDQNIAERAYFPAAFPNENIIAVGAVNNLGEMWSGSSYGRWTVDVLAPGQSILSTSPRYPLVQQQFADYIVSDGTSQATAYVTGLVALIRANANTASLDAKAIRRLVLSSGKPIANSADRIGSGALVRLADSNGRGVLTCNNKVFRRRQQPQATSMIALPGETVALEVQNFNCSAPGTETSISVSVAPIQQTVVLLDDGIGNDKTAGDGVYSGSWTVPYGQFEYQLSSGWDSVSGQNDILTIKAGIIVDNTDSSTDYVGKWWATIYRSGFYGSNYRYATEADPEKIFTWSPTVNTAGYYRAYARWPQGSNFATNSTYRVHHQSIGDGSAQVNEVQVDQTKNGNQWRDLGVYWFDAGIGAIELTNANANGTVVADAVQLVPEP